MAGTLSSWAESMGSWGHVQGFGLYPEDTENRCGGQVLSSLPTAPPFSWGSALFRTLVLVEVSSLLMVLKVWRLGTSRETCQWREEMPGHFSSSLPIC